MLTAGGEGGKKGREKTWKRDQAKVVKLLSSSLLVISVVILALTKCLATKQEKEWEREHLRLTDTQVARDFLCRK
jgi:hypothetical protein